MAVVHDIHEEFSVLRIDMECISGSSETQVLWDGLNQARVHLLDRVVLDLGAVQTIEDIALGKLLWFVRQISRVGSDCAVVGLRDDLKPAFAALKHDPGLESFDSLEAYEQAQAFST